MESDVRELSGIVEERFDGIRISDYLKMRLGLSVTLVKRVKLGGVFINGENVHMRALVHEGDEVLVKLPSEASDGIRAIDMPLNIVYEDEYIIAVSKPSGMPTHPSRGNSLPTLAEGIMAYFRDEKFVFRAINRLDRDTSGIVIIAKDAITGHKLSLQMKEGGYKKKYYAIVCGVPCPTEGTVDAPIERECEGSMRRCVREGGKAARSDYRVLRTLPSGNSLCEVTLHTGRTHQIRVHMAYIGHPLYADFLYGERVEGENYKLHAREIGFVHPMTGERLELISKCDFE